jgi:hypothetical protein
MSRRGPLISFSAALGSAGVGYRKQRALRNGLSMNMKRQYPRATPSYLHLCELFQQLEQVTGCRQHSVRHPKLFRQCDPTTYGGEDSRHTISLSLASFDSDQERRTLDELALDVLELRHVGIGASRTRREVRGERGEESEGVGRGDEGERTGGRCVEDPSESVELDTPRSVDAE